MMKFGFLGLTVLGFLNHAQASDFLILESNFAFKPSSSIQALYQDDRIQIFANPKAAKPLSVTSPLYVIRARNRSVLNKILGEKNVEVFGMVSESVAVRFPESMADQVSALLHTEGGVHCGGLVRVSEEVPYLAPKSVHRSAVQEFPAPDSARAEVDALKNSVSKDELTQSITSLGGFFSRHHRSTTAAQSHEWIVSKIREISPNIEIEEVTHENTPQKSIVATLRGTSDERVIIGAHIDSIQGFGGNPDRRRAPGQDDDASGVSSILEVLRVVAQSGIKFERTLQFMGYAAEEIGLVGSEEIADAYAERGVPVKAVLQLDMDGYIKPGDEMKVFFVSNDTTPQLNRFLQSLVDTFLGIPWAEKELDFGTSDHLSWHRRGFMATFPTENPDAFNYNLHTPEDTIDKLDVRLTEAYTKLGVAFMVTLGVPVR